MLVLGIESTCDETSCAIVKDGFEILAHVTKSQINLHREFGGVVPELACRDHITTITPVIQETLSQAGLSLDDIDLIAVARGPGLIGALLIGITYAKGLAWAKDIPLIGVNHIEAHLYAAMMSLTPDQLQFPALGAILSGGHTSLVLINQIGQYKLLAETVDDAIGEAFDKVAKILDLPYPGGPEIEKLAQHGNPHSIAFRTGKVKEQPLNFSFSGLKTNVLYTVRGKDLKRSTPLSLIEKQNIAASFQYTAFSDVIGKLKLALSQYPYIKEIFLGGGVVQNQKLRSMLKEAITLPIHWPKPELCLDNAAMIAGLGYHKFFENPKNMLFDLEAQTRISF